MQGCPDLVFGNCAVVLDGKAILARYLRAERVGEEEHGGRMFEQLQARGLVDEMHRTPDGVYFEGAGDAIFDPDRRIMWMGHGQRSCRAARETVEAVFGIPTISLELVDPGATTTWTRRSACCPAATRSTTPALSASKAARN